MTNKPKAIGTGAGMSVLAWQVTYAAVIVLWTLFVAYVFNGWEAGFAAGVGVAIGVCIAAIPMRDER